jgi:hypothetical protein
MPYFRAFPGFWTAAREGYFESVTSANSITPACGLPRQTVPYIYSISAAKLQGFSVWDLQMERWRIAKGAGRALTGTMRCADAEPCEAARTAIGFL